jgi:hypothetical protein
MILMTVSLCLLTKRFSGEELLRNLFGLSKDVQMLNYSKIKKFVYGMATVLKSILTELESIDKKEILALFMVSNGDIGMLPIQQNKLIIQEKESTSWRGLLMKLREILQVVD